MYSLSKSSFKKNNTFFLSNDLSKRGIQNFYKVEKPSKTSTLFNIRCAKFIKSIVLV